MANADCESEKRSLISSAPEIARRLADLFEAERVPYAIGGALALGIWGFPRATNDVDMDLFVDIKTLPRILQMLQQNGFTLNIKQALHSSEDRGDFTAKYGNIRIDFFVPSIPFYQSVETRCRQAPLLHRHAWFLSPEDLTVFKLLFFRTKDILDVERLVAFCGEDFDIAYVTSWLENIVGVEDERYGRWKKVLEDCTLHRAS